MLSSWKYWLIAKNCSHSHIDTKRPYSNMSFIIMLLDPCDHYSSSIPCHCNDWYYKMYMHFSQSCRFSVYKFYLDTRILLVKSPEFHNYFIREYLVSQYLWCYQILAILQLLTKISLPLTLATILGEVISMEDEMYPLQTPCTHVLTDSSVKSILLEDLISS